MSLSLPAISFTLPLEVSVCWESEQDCVLHIFSEIHRQKKAKMTEMDSIDEISFQSIREKDASILRSLFL